MTYYYIKAIHLIFIVTWFAGLFYIVRLCIYHVEAQGKSEPARTILSSQYSIMMKRLWYGITWPSAILTLIFGAWMWYLIGNTPAWLLVKFGLVMGLYLYHFSIQRLIVQQLKGDYIYTSTQLRIWNELATVFLVCIVTIAVVKQRMSVMWAFAGFIALVIILMSAIRIYRNYRKTHGDI